MAPRSKGAQNTNDEEILFDDETVVAQGIEGDLYSDFDSTVSEEGEETDWEHYERDVTFGRKGNAVNMFKESIVEEALKHASKELRSVYLQFGPLKIKPKDVPSEMSDLDVEFRQEGYKNEAGDVYVGEFRSNTNVREGRGLLISSENYMYEGFWMDDKKFGFGRILIHNGCAYQGQWQDDASHGLGVYCNSDKLIYKGEWKNNKCHGSGFEKYADGTKFKGKFLKGLKEGKGILKWADGREFKGTFEKGLMEGYGE